MRRGALEAVLMGLRITASRCRYRVRFLTRLRGHAARDDARCSVTRQQDPIDLAFRHPTNSKISMDGGRSIRMLEVETKKGIH